MIAVNLLPDSILQLRRRQHVKRQGIFWTSLVIGTLGLVALICVGLMLFSIQQRNEAKQVNTETWQQYSSDEETEKREEVLAVVSSIDALLAMSNTQRQFSIFLDDMADNLPQDVALRSLGLDASNEFQVEGRALGSYDGIATYLQRLRAQDDLFSGVTLFSANTVSDALFGFNLSGFYEGGIPEQEDDGQQDAGATSEDEQSLNEEDNQ